MRPKPIPVHQLARETGVDIDTVLLTLWDLAHIDPRALDIVNRKDKIPAPLLDPLRRSLGIATRRDLTSVRHWLGLLGMSRDDFQSMLTERGYSLNSRHRRLPPGALKFLNQLARSRRIDPLTGKTRAPTAPSRDSRQRRSVQIPPPSFAKVGRHAASFRWLSFHHVTAIHDALVTDFAHSGDPIAPPGVRDRGLLESAVFRPQTGFDGMLKYPTIETSAAALLCALIHDHPFHNGNKRTALVATLAFLDRHDLVLTCSADHLFQFVFLIARHNVTTVYADHLADDYETFAVAETLCRWTRVVHHVEVAPTVSFRKLRRILQRRACSIEIKGSKAIITRRRKMGSLRSFSRRSRAQIPYRDEGTNVPPGDVRMIRKKLHLDPEHGHDDADFFFRRTPTPIDAFIVRYRKILVRLAKH